MAKLTSEQLGQHIIEYGLATRVEINDVEDRLGSVDVTIDEYKACLLNHELLTNWQLQRLEQGHRTGYYYGNWKVLYLVGVGTFARVYRAVNNKTGEKNAVKVLRNRYADNDGVRDRFVREGQLVMKLRHPNIVPIHEVDDQLGRVYMVMDFIEGQNMRDYIRSQEKLSALKSLEITRDILSALDYSSQHGITHRDMKLSNILLASSGRASLADFGLAIADGSGEDTTYNPRSVDYAGLEKTTGVCRDDKRSDIFFVGCCLYQLLAGRPPLMETRERLQRLDPRRYRDITPLATLVPNLPERVVFLTQRMMEIDPEKRFQTPRIALNATSTAIKMLRAGETKVYDSKRSQEDQEKYDQRKLLENEGIDFTVMLIESHTKIQNNLRRKFKESGYQVRIFENPVLALDRFDDLDPAEDSPADCVLFGCVNLGSKALDAFKRFRDLTADRAIPSVLLVHKDQAKRFMEELELGENQRVLVLPSEASKIKPTVRELLKIESSD